MKLRHGLLITVAAVLVSGVVFAGGSSESEGASDEPIEMTLYWQTAHMYGPYLEAIEAFEERNNVEVEVLPMAWDDMKAKLNADFAASTPPDLVEVHHTWAIEFGNRGEVMNLTDRIEAWPESDDWLESTWTDVSDFDGNIFGVKMHHTCYALFWNRELFRQAGLDPDDPPETLEEMVEYIDIIDAELGPDIKGYGFDPGGQFLHPFLVTEDHPYMVMDGRSSLNRPDVLETLEIMQGIARSGKAFVPDPGGEAGRVNVRAMFLSGNFAMQITGPWELSNIKNNFPDFDYGVAMVPHLEGVPGRTYSTGTAMVIPTDSPHPELAWELLTDIVDVETQVQTTIEHGMLMPRISWASDPRIQDLKEVIYFRDLLPLAYSFDIGASQYVVPEITHFGNVWDRMYQTMLYTDDDMGAALEEYAEEANRLLAAAQQ